MPVVLLSDTFEQFGRPLMAQLGWPLLLCHTLVVEDDRLADYRLRLPDQKARAVEAFRSLNYRVAGVGRLLQRHDHAGCSRCWDPVPGPRQREGRASAVSLLH